MEQANQYKPSEAIEDVAVKLFFRVSKCALPCRFIIRGGVVFFVVIVTKEPPVIGCSPCRIRRTAFGFIRLKWWFES